ncbi:uncharacterized protein LOC128429897 [Pleuronectes platessa]|uniref:uncharacterized protein LOC128429897 n=1 Tax=Pleuronectes platessa TaxID=8262 RepID=UPI00232A14A2|nr:uncharacterized protein LOC128429897 [Pleuronectes platessa]
MKLLCARDVLFPAEKTHKIRGRMIPWILMLFILTPCVCAGTLVVNVKQPSYQAKVDGNITLEWTFTAETQRPFNDLSIICDQTVNRRDSKILYHLHKGIEVQRSQDQQFSGRVQCDEDFLRDGRLRLHVSRIRSEDSGQYVCEVNRDHDGNYGKCQLVVIKPADQPTTRRPDVTSQPEGKMGLYFPPLVAAAVLVLVLVLVLTAVGITAALLVKRRSASKTSISKTEELLAREKLGHPEYGLLSDSTSLHPVAP